MLAEYLEPNEENYDTSHDNCIAPDELRDLVDKFDTATYLEMTEKDLIALVNNFTARLRDLCDRRSQ